MGSLSGGEHRRSLLFGFIYTFRLLSSTGAFRLGFAKCSERRSHQTQPARMRLASLSVHSLPACFLNTRDLTFVSQLTEAYSADAVFSQYGMGTAADFAAAVFSCGEFLFALLFDFH